MSRRTMSSPRVWCLLFLVVTNCETRERVRYMLPKDFKGWARVEYANRRCSPLRTNGKYRVVTFSNNGVACTSDPFASGEAADEFVSGEGSTVRNLPRYVKIWHLTFWDCSFQQYESFFVGTEEEWKSAPREPACHELYGPTSTTAPVTSSRSVPLTTSTMSSTGWRAGPTDL
jgi:hypothetical protein